MTMRKMSERNKLIARLDRMNGIKKMKKRTLTPKQLKAKYEHDIRDLVIKRDKYKCQIAGRYHTCNGRLVADHRPVKRGNNRYFFDPRNLTTVCNAANFLAEFDPAVNAAICEVVKAREGLGVYETMIETKSQPFKVTEEYVLGIIEDLKRKAGQ
jgi:hypothetical protein